MLTFRPSPWTISTPTGIPDPDPSDGGLGTVKEVSFVFHEPTKDGWVEFIPDYFPPPR